MQPKQNEIDRLSVGDAAKLIGISRDTLKRWESDGRITAARTPTGHRRFLRSDVEALLRDEATA